MLSSCIIVFTTNLLSRLQGESLQLGTFNSRKLQRYYDEQGRPYFVSEEDTGGVSPTNESWQQVSYEQEQHEIQLELPDSNRQDSYIEATEFDQLWSTLPVAANFQCHVEHVPSIEKMSSHLANTGFWVVATGIVESTQKVYAYSTWHETGSLFHLPLLLVMSS